MGDYHARLACHDAAGEDDQIAGGGLALFLRPWLRVHESASRDDNPDITDYLGYGESPSAHATPRKCACGKCARGKCARRRARAAHLTGDQSADAGAGCPGARCACRAIQPRNCSK